MKYRFCSYLVLAAASAQPVLACDLCAIFSAQQAEGAGKGFYGGMAEQFTSFGTLRAYNREIANDEHSYIASSITQVFAGYNFSSRFGLQFNLPIIHRYYGVDGMHDSETGIGDVSLIANGVLLRKYWGELSFNWTALGGVKLPSGSSAWLGKEDYAEGIGGHDLTLGSGSVDGIVGTGFTASWRRIFLNGNMQYAIRTEGDHGYQFANDWTWAGGPGAYVLLNDNYTLSVQALVSGESKGLDTSKEEGTLHDSAETIVFLGPQIAFTWRERLSAHIGADLPVSVETFHSSDEPQLVPDFRIHAAITWRF